MSAAITTRSITLINRIQLIYICMTSRRVLPRSIHSVFSSSYVRTYVRRYVEDRPFERAFLLRTTSRGSNNIFQRVSRCKGYKLRENYRSISSLADFSPLPRAKYTNFFFVSRCISFSVERNENVVNVNTNRRSRNLDLDRGKGVKRGEIISRRKRKRKRKKRHGSPREEAVENRDDRS